MLDQAGVAYRVVAPAVDEDAVKAAHGGDDAALALALAEAKALSVAPPAGRLGDRRRFAWSASRARYSKPRDRAEAAEHLALFSGRTMQLSSAVALARDGAIEWSHASTARRCASARCREAFIDAYLDAEWPEVAYCVGVFRMEGRGVTLFEQVEGSHFTILGMPLLPLLGALRERGLMAS